MNWKQLSAAITSSLTILAMVPFDLYEGTLKPFASAVPAGWKPTIVLGGLVATIALRIWNATTTPK